MSDAAQANISKYKAGFTNNAQKKDFCKTTPLKIVSGVTEQMKALGLGGKSAK
jgi:hypothetical protein